MAGDVTARGVAARLVQGVVEDRTSLADQVQRGALAVLAPPDRARAQRLALATLRNLSRADAVLRPLMRRHPPAAIRSILRVAVTEMLAEGAAPHGVVGDAVRETRALGQQFEGFTGLVNAVLRRASGTPADQWSSLPAPELPGWLRGRLMSAYGKKATQAMEAAHAKGAPLDLTPKDGDAAALAARLGAEALLAGSVRLPVGVQVTELPGYETGHWWVQDAAAALAAKFLGVRPGERALDLCAAPGGKTLQLAAAGAEVTALDLSEHRLERVRENLARCGLAATIVAADALTWDGPRDFEAVLLDAPCSATGTIRRHPDLPYVRDGVAIRNIARLQADLIDSALAQLAPGGRLVYATCSLLPEEGEDQITAALARHHGLAIDRAALDHDWTLPHWKTPEGGLRTRPDDWPERGGLDGFYIAALRRS
jgi:16S rRNA (cytosine967-C5)-methyltransferase